MPITKEEFEDIITKLDSIKKLEDENKKMRELCDEMFRDLVNADYELKSRTGRTFMVVARYYDRIKELGVR